jgi:hypothetical protein
MASPVGCYNTVYRGYLVAQVFTEHIYPPYEEIGLNPIQPPPSISDARLVQIHPRKRELKKFAWPTTAFTNGGPNGYSMNCWKRDVKRGRR